MSDIGRKNLSDKVSESVTPDSQKSGFDKAKETVTDKVDEFSRKAVPDNQKSFSQSAADKFSEGKEDAKDASNHEAHSLGDTAKEYLDSAKSSASGAVNYISEVMGGAHEGAKNSSENAKSK